MAFELKQMWRKQIASVTTWQSESNCINMEILWNYSFFFLFCPLVLLICSSLFHFAMQMGRKLSGNSISGWVDEHHVIFCAINQCRSNVMLAVISLFWLQWKSNVQQIAFVTLLIDILWHAYERTFSFFVAFFLVDCLAFMLSSSRENSAILAMTSSFIEIPNLGFSQSISTSITFISFE